MPDYNDNVTPFPTTVQAGSPGLVATAAVASPPHDGAQAPEVVTPLAADAPRDDAPDCPPAAAGRDTPVAAAPRDVHREGRGPARSLAAKFVTPTKGRRTCSVANSPYQVEDDQFVTPSKLRKVSAEKESPSDKLSSREVRKKTPIRKSVKFDFQKVEKDFLTGEDVPVYKKDAKVYTSQDSLPLGRVNNSELANFFACRVCGNYPRTAMVSIRCAHIYCKVCIENYRKQVDSSKCPPVHVIVETGQEQEDEVTQCMIPSDADHIIEMAGLLQEIHKTIKFTCSNNYCDKEFNVEEIFEHEKICKVRGYYSQEKGSISSTRNQLLRKESSKTMNMILKWCKDFDISPCDFLFFTLKRLIRAEAPELEDSVEEVFKSFLDKSKIEKNLLSAMEGLAIKVDADLSNSQYQKLRGNRVYGDKLPSLGRVNKAKGNLDPGNVDYTVYSLATGEVLDTHEAEPNSGIIDVDDELGNMSYGDLNINVHGCRSTLHNTIAKLVEEKYPDIESEILKHPDSTEILSDKNRQITVFAKVCFDGTTAPVTSAKGASRLSVNSWLRGTVGIVGIEIIYHSSNSQQAQADDVEDNDVGDVFDNVRDVDNDDVQEEEVEIVGSPTQEGDEASSVFEINAHDVAQMDVETVSLLISAMPDNLSNMTIRDIVSRSNR